MKRPARPCVPLVPASAAGPSFALASLLAALAAPAQATLGQPIGSVAAVQVRLQASAKVAQRPGHQLHELTLPTGTVVREYTDAGGTVFAVSWQGPFKPNLKVLLGNHFQRLDAAGRQPHPGHAALAVRSPDLVIESGGRMRAFAGRAYLPARLPAGFSFEVAP